MLEPTALRELWGADAGALRDIYVPNTSPETWQLALDAVTARWPSSYAEDAMPTLMPSDVREILARRDDQTTNLTIHLSQHLDVQVYFFESHQVEFTFDPNDIADDADVYRVLDLVLHLGRTLKRPVHMTCESHPWDRPPSDLRYDPELDRIVPMSPPPKD